MNINTILVPQGSEYKAVCRGLKRVTGQTPKIVSIPVGIKPLTKYLHQWQRQEYPNEQQPRVLVMGLCGSLSPRYHVGDVVLYENCIYQQQLQKCDRSLTIELQSALKTQQPAVSLVKSLTSDRVICSAGEKRHLGETLGADVVDMEGFAALDFFNGMSAAVAMLRVVSDDSHHDIPDLTAAINADGSLQPLPLALSLLRQPIAATRLIRGSLRGLKVLEELTKLLLSG
ncbi:phosphorylase family protein [Anabaena azotica]|uniref:Phosphorylase n=1 Tax=Anabaena azotica FACHB-119 TaxID=947527 RepID=A0ABR8D9E8_9NOST|nr:phosphorylase [Anabaena azotica]MBD2503820.1 phosphorylase [Anabaena azotica FACHB-119]